jgi:hypothetical protein
MVHMPTIILFKSALPITSQQLPTTITNITISNSITSYPLPCTWSPITKLIAINWNTLSLFWSTSKCSVIIIGVKNGAKTLHYVTGLSLTDVAVMSKGLASEKQILPRIVADCSNLLFLFSKCTSVVSAVAGHLSRIAATAVAMVPVCDGAIFPISKQATNKKIAIAGKELSQIKAHHCQKKISN